MKELLINVTVIILLTTILDMLLPEGKMQPFVRMAMGLFIIVTILSPILNLINKDAWLDSWILTEKISDGESMMTIGENWAEENEDAVLLAYQNKLERQISGLIYLLDDVAECQTEIILKEESRLGDAAQIEKVTVFIKQNAQNNDLAKRVQKMLCSCYDLTKEAVEVRLE